MRPYIGSWKRLAVSGVAAVLFGLATLVWPGVTLWALVVLWGASTCSSTASPPLSAAITDRLLVNRGWVAFWGVTGIAAGVVTFLWPSITALGAARGHRDVVADHRRLPDRVRHLGPQAGAGRLGRSGSAAPCWCCSACCCSPTPASEPRHHLGDRVARLRCPAASSCGSRPMSEARRTNRRGRPASTRRGPHRP